MLNYLRRILRVIWKGENYCKGCKEKDKRAEFAAKLEVFIVERLAAGDFSGLQKELGNSRFVSEIIKRGEFSRLYWCANEKDFSDESMKQGMDSRVVDVRISLESKPCKYGPRRSLGLFGTSEFPPLFQMKKRGGSVWAIDDSGPLPKPINNPIEAILVKADEQTYSVTVDADRLLGVLLEGKQPHWRKTQEKIDGIFKTLSEKSPVREDAGEAPEKSGKD